MPSLILDTTNCNRTYLEIGKPASADFYSKIADFRDMPMGSVQVVWRNLTGSFDGEIRLYASNLPEDDSFFDGGEIDGAIIPINSASGNRMWIRDRLGFRYLQARFVKNGITGGEIDIVGLGKKS